MGIDLTGVDFVALDSEGFGDGASDQTTRFLSAYKERRLDANARYLRGLATSTSYSPPMPFDMEGQKGAPFSLDGLAERAYMLQPVYLEPGLERVKLYLLASVHVPTGAEGDVLARMQVGSAEVEQELEPSLTPQQYTLEVEVNPQNAGWYPLALWLSESIVQSGDIHVRIYTASMQVRYDPDLPGVRWTPKSPAEMHARSPVLGQHTTQHGTNADAIYDTPRCLAMGSRGTPDPGGEWPEGYHSRYRWVFGDAGGVLQDDQITPFCERGALQVRGFLAGMHLANVFDAEPDDIDIQHLRARAARADWRLTLSVEQFDLSTGAWAEVASKAVTQEIRHFPPTTAGRRKWNLLYGLGQAYFGKPYDGTPDYIEGGEALSALDVSQILEPYAVSVGVGDLDLTKMTRARLDVELVGTPQYYEGRESERITSRLLLVNAGSSVWEFGAA